MIARSCFLLHVCVFFAIVVGVLSTCLAAGPGDWEPAKETVVIYNSKLPSSKALAEEYAELRNIPEERLVGLACSGEETISREAFEDSIREPLLRKFIKAKWWEMEKRDLIDPNGKVYGQSPQVVSSRVSVLVIMRGVPLRIARSARSDAAGQEDEASVDSELAALGMVNRNIKGVIENRYYESTLSFADHHQAKGQLLVGRMDAADDETVRRMMLDTIHAEKVGLWGRAVVDFSLKDGAYVQGDQWLGRSVALYRERGVPVYAERSKEVLAGPWPLPDTILYFGWYTPHVAGAFADENFRFKRGAIACHLHSFSAASLRDPKAYWCAPLLAHGAAATLGNVWEPYLTLTVRFDVLNARLLDGFTLGEAAWAATPGLSWMNVLIGDPLYRPFGKNRENISDDQAALDYALYHDFVQRYLQHDGKKLRREILRVAVDKKSARLLELVGLLCAIEENFGQAGDFFQHARALYDSDEDKLRCLLYDAEFMRRGGMSVEALAMLNAMDETPKSPYNKAREAIRRQLGGK